MYRLVKNNNQPISLDYYYAMQTFPRMVYRYSSSGLASTDIAS